MRSLFMRDSSWLTNRFSLSIGGPHPGVDDCSAHSVESRFVLPIEGLFHPATSRTLAISHLGSRSARLPFPIGETKAGQQHVGGRLRAMDWIVFVRYKNAWHEMLTDQV